jgi:DNA polymerase-3 subunit delta'
VARAKRPMSTNDPTGRAPVIGQDPAVDALRKAIECGRLAQSWLFHGPEGVGKRTTALRLARLLLDPATTPALIGSFSPPSDTKAQTLIDARTHPDLVVLSKDMAADSQIPRLRDKKQVDIPADLLREHIIGGVIKGENRVFEPAVQLSPRIAPRRVFIIDEAELLNPTGQNVLLKTLEEPPATSTLILLSTNPARMLPTIRSRCQTLGFGRLDEAAMGSWIETQSFEASTTVLAQARTFAQGSPGRLLFAIEHDLAAWETRLGSGLRDLCAGTYPVALASDLAKLIDDFAKAKEKLNRRTSLEAAKREGLQVILSFVAGSINTQMLGAVEAGDSAAADRCARALDPLVEAEGRIARSLNLKMVLADMVSKIAEAMRPLEGVR